MTLTIRIPTTRLEGEDRRCWIERTTLAQRKTVAGYETHSYTPIRCIGHVDRKDCLFITLERWIDYSTGRRDIQRVQLLISNSGEITGLHRYPIEITQWGDSAQPALPIPPKPQPNVLPVASDRGPTVIQNGDRIRFLEGSEHPELAGTESTATRVGTMRLLATADATRQAVSISLEQVQLVERSPEPVPTATKPRRARNARSRQSEAITAPSA